MLTNKKRVGAVAAAAMIGALGLGAVAVPANAAPANIDPDAPTSLTINKYEQQETIPATGPLVPLEGVEFSVTPVTSIDGDAIDLLDSTGWDIAAPYLTGATPFDIADAVTGTPLTGATDAAGQLIFDDIPIGLYWVQETGAGGNNIVQPMAPFLVTVPIPGELPGTWVYDVVANPKNSTFNAEETVNDVSAVALGDIVTWSVSTVIPFFPADQELTNLQIVDNLPDEVSYESATVTVTKNGVPVTLVEGVDYTITHTAGVVTFTALNPTKAVFAGASVVLNIDTEVVSIGTGTITNDATVSINDADIDVDADTLWGAATINKEATGSDLRLTGAEFQVYATEADADAGTNPIAVQVGGVDIVTFVTDANGTITIPGLKASDAGITYFIKETKAPAGYVAADEVYPVTITPGSLAEAIVLEVDNEQQPGGVIPPTGGVMGTILPIAGGVLLAAGAVTLIVRRRNAVEA